MNTTIKNLRKLSKDQLVYTVYQLENTHKQAVTDHAMEVSRLNTAIQTERKTNEHWRTEANKYQHEAAAARNELQKVQGKCHNQEQIIRELGTAVTKLGECIAHL